MNAESVVSRDEFFSGVWVIYSLANSLGDVFRQFSVGFFIGKNFAEVSQPNSKSGLVVQAIPEFHSLIARNFIEASAVWFVFKPTRGPRASCEDLVVPRLDIGHFLDRNGPVVEGCAPVGPSLEDR